MDAPRPLTVVTWNIRGNHSPDVALVAELLQRIDADVIALQEVRRLQARQLARRLGMSHTWAFKHNGYTRLVPWRAEGHSILSAHPMSSTGHRCISYGEPRRSFRRRIAQWADVSMRGLAVRIINTHLAAHDLDRARLDQARLVRSIVEAADAQRTLVVGDFNDHREPLVVATMAGSSHVDAWDSAIRRSALGLTNPTDAPRQRLDHVIVPAQWRVIDAHVPATNAVWRSVSDHLPVIVSLDQIRSK